MAVAGSSKYFQTAAKMDEALLTLLEQKDFAYITVKEICRTAGVNRSTFYLHYETLGDLLEESIRHMNEQFLACMPQDTSVVPRLRECPEEELDFVTPAYLVPYLRYIRAHRRLFRAALSQPKTLRAEEAYEQMMQHVFGPILERYGVPETDRGYLMAFYIHGLLAIVRQWLRGDCADGVEHVAAMMEQCVRRRRPDGGG